MHNLRIFIVENVNVRRSVKRLTIYGRKRCFQLSALGEERSRSLVTV